MGVKAVWSKLDAPVICFGSRDKSGEKGKAHFSLARRTAERAQERPYIVTIGGGKDAPNALGGRVLELVCVTGAYGDTTTLVQNDDVRSHLARWPVSVVASEVYEIKGDPHLINDLGFPDRRILTNVFDNVSRNDDYIQQLWSALKDWPVERRWDMLPPLRFRDPKQVVFCESMYPELDITTTEGQQIWKRSKIIERDPQLRHQAKARNRAANDGVLVCEACCFSDTLDAMFDAHHLHPLAVGIRESRVDDLAVLCPTCHRWAHAKAVDHLSPLPVMEIASSMAASKAQVL